ncbi:MAG: SulP family inorganic anion transporter [Betaproteobacteria bacterium]
MSERNPATPVASSVLQRLLPFLDWWPRMNAKSLRLDVLAGITVALVAIPQALAYAQLAGLPPYYGLYAALLPTIVGALFGSSGQLSTGPVALTALVTAASIAAVAPATEAQYIASAIALALLAGLFQLAFGILRLGVLMNLLSNPVLMGFVNAAAILITLSQVPALVGTPAPGTGHALSDGWFVLSHIAQAHPPSIAFAVAALGALIAFRRLWPRLPGVLITVVLLTAVSYAAGFASHGGQVVGDIPRGLPALALPEFAPDAWIIFLPAAFVIAIISFMEAMSSAKIAEIRTGTKWDENQELIGQGLAKLAAALSQTMPVSGSFSRSALNLSVGARTGVSSIVCALCVLLALLFVTPLLYHLPLPVLAAIIVMALSGLINLHPLRVAHRASRDDAVAAILTFVATIAYAPQIQNGIYAGILVSLGLFIYRRMRPTVEVVEPDSDQLMREMPAEAPAGLTSAVGIVRFEASLVFVNVSFFEAAVRHLEHQHRGLRYVLVSAASINRLDASGVEMLSSLQDSLGRNGVTMAFSGANADVLAVMERTGLARRIGAENFFLSERAAFAALASRFAQLQVPPPQAA